MFGRDGIQVLAGVQIASVSTHDGQFTVDLSTARAGQRARSCWSPPAAGRTSATRAGHASGSIRGAGRSRWTSGCGPRDGLWAVGDVTGKGAFTHMAMYQAAIAARDILGEDGPPADYRALPRVTFTDPEVGAVGLTEQQARDAGLTVRIGLTDAAGLDRGWIHKAGNEGFIKLVEDADRGVLVGATSVGPGRRRGARRRWRSRCTPRSRSSTLQPMIYAYPTFHRAIESAVKDLAAS